MGKPKTFPGIKVCVIGDKSVGKYALGQQYAKGWIEPKDTNKSPNAFCPTKVVEILSRKFSVTVQICQDIDNDEQLNNCDGIVLVFSVTDKSTFTHVNALFKKLREKFSDKPQNGVHGQNTPPDQANTDNSTEKASLSIPVILVGNKVDDAKLSRQVETEDGQSLSQELACIGFFETSALCNAEVPKAFNTLLEEVAKRKNDVEPAMEKPTNACCVII